MDKQSYLLENLHKWLEDSGLQPELEKLNKEGLCSDMVVHGCSPKILVEAKVAHDYRSKVFPSLVGDLILRAQAHSDCDIMAAFLIRKFNHRAVQDLEAYTVKYRPNLHWFLLDEAGMGAAKLHNKHSELSFSPFPKRGGHHFSTPSFRSKPFSEVDRHLLKALLMPGMASKYWGGPRHRPESIMKLARQTEVPQPRVSKFVKKFEDLGYIRREGRQLIVVRHEELLDDWFHALKNEKKFQQPVRSMYGGNPDDLIKRLRSLAASKDSTSVIVGHHLGCHLHGIGRSSVKSAMLYVVDRENAMMDLDLVSDNSNSPSLWLIERDIESVSQGAVEAEGVHVCDILQCYLDVRGSKVRGQEQADFILDNILMPHFRRT